MARRLVVSSLLAGLLVGCASAAPSPTDPTAASADPSLSPSASTSTPTPPSPTLSTPTVPPSPAGSTARASLPTWSSVAADLAWHRLGTIPSSFIVDVVGFTPGYVALDGSAAWHSKDGRSWKRSDLPIDVPMDVALDATGMLGRAIATAGEPALIVGGYSHTPCAQGGSDTGTGPQCAISPIAWSSDDGRTWRRLDPVGVESSELVAAWPVAGGGWTAAGSDWYGEALGGDRLWSSPDGADWSPASSPPAPWEGYEHAPLGIASGSGEVLLAAAERGGGSTTLAASVDEGPWRVLDGFPGDAVEVVAGAAPTDGYPRWVLGGASGCDTDLGCVDGPTIWSSIDGVDWTTIHLPVGEGVPGEDGPIVVSAVTSLALSERGYVAVGAVAAEYEGARHETWVSDDGVAWTQVPQGATPRFDYGPGVVAAGPAGVIGISGSEVEDEHVAWLLR